MTPTIRSSASLVVLSCLLLLSSTTTTTAFNIAKILSQYPDYGVFNGVLNATHLVPEINKRQTITVLAVKDSDMSAITSKPIETQKQIISTHIVLDYYDQQKLTHLKSGSSLLTTLFQTTGVASWNNGFLNVTNKKAQGGIVFGSGTKGAPLNSHLNKYVYAQPYNISIIEVSSVIIAPGLDGAPIGPAMPPTPAAPVAPAPAPSKKKPAAAPAPEEAEVPVADAPVAEEPVADAPVATSPSPSSSPSPAEADKPADDDDKQAPPPKKSSAAKAFASSLVLLVSFIASL